jgi:uncharacterized protein YbbC (DUF1343 family)
MVNATTETVPERDTVVRTGLENLLAQPPDSVRGANLGLVTNPCGIDRHRRSAIDLIAGHPELNLVALYGPEHGIRGEVQAGDHVASETDPRTGLPVLSLYGETRMPTAEMLDGIDVLLIDLQDIGTRFTTYISTLDNLLVAGNSHGKRVVILDRPNPLGGSVVAGNILDPDYRTFIGTHPITTVHGMTMAEIGRMIATERNLAAPDVVPMSGWDRSMTWNRTGLPWVFPSPNLPTLDTHFAYAATCLFEGTNWSEGRGTTRPFELIGAPWVDPWAFAEEIERRQLPGIDVRPLYFTPLYSKHTGDRCGGVQIEASEDALPFAPVIGVHLLDIAFRLDAETAWLTPPREGARYFIDMLTGSRQVRDTIDGGGDLASLADDWNRQSAVFRDRRAAFLLYDSGAN